MSDKIQQNRGLCFRQTWMKRVSAVCEAYGIRPETAFIMCRDFGEQKMLFLLKKYAEKSSLSRRNC